VSAIEALEIIQEKKLVQLLDMRLSEMESWVQELGQPKFRARQIFTWLYKDRVTSIDEMSNLPKSFRDQ
jgi:23S rRNA (adenine2503-C2)-methyltransferase